ncbi:endonuclease III domain-containing protein [Calditerrivibrio nitroreducens]|uniref:Endonuclease III n=1 Tax=Calditerrivibrio nitroreducens (strain DSM 19672 / NBRC 101217 / Yu37-1) TaxID=768670 RepID=E4TFR5_CALNY|nr:endonuclease III [Calditerrivibrio nitroreducens]ADR18533.1 DNA-(apurinic or apyrimidinic site) lyase [Calditerrivibrio nitroreducens DSM 19672]
MNFDIDKLFLLLESEYKRFETPSVTKIANLIKSNPFAVLISTLISLRTKDEVTLKASERLFSRADNPFDMLKLSTDEVERLIYPAGFYRKKSLLILDISKYLVENYQGRVPNSLDELLKIKGVGRKTANLVLVEGFGVPAVCVDTHVHRIMNRMGLVNTKNPDETEMVLRDKLPVKYWIKWNEYLVAYGQNVCKPISPLCSTCKLSDFCAKINIKRWR